MLSRRYLVSTEVRGTSSKGSWFDDTLASADLNEAAISRIVVMHGTVIDSIEVHYVKGKKDPTRRGGSGDRQDEVILEPYEIITSIEGGSNESHITHLTFITNKRTFGPFGERKGEFFVWTASNRVPSDTAPRMGLVHFRGTASSSYIYSLQATFAEYPYGAQPSNTAKYESLPSPVVESAKVAASSSLCKFARHLMATVITLQVGSEPIEFHAYEDTLCRLPFFRAALLGEFKEASEKIVKMPEDDVASVAALLEFLSVGSYTYAYTPDTTRFHDHKPHVPIGDLAQGLFHVAVYATASKYDCSRLVDEAVNNFKAVVKELQGIDILRLWKAAYAEGLGMSDWGKGEGPSVFHQGLPKWVAGLTTEHREEMEKTMAEYPALACDLLGFSTASVDS